MSGNGDSQQENQTQYIWEVRALWGWCVDW